MVVKERRHESGGERRGRRGQGREEEGGDHLHHRLREASGGQDHGHRLPREVPPGAHQGSRREARSSRRLGHRLPRQEQDNRHLGGPFLQEVTFLPLPHRSAGGFLYTCSFTIRNLGYIRLLRDFDRSL